MKTVDPRNILAAERTMLAWIRTGLSMMGFGFVVARFSLLLKQLVAAQTKGVISSRPGLSLWIGIVMVALGVGTNFFAGLNYYKNVKRLQQNEALLISEWPAGRIVSLMLVFVGVIMAGYLVSLA